MPCLLIDTSGSSIVLGAADRNGRLLAAKEVEHNRENSMHLPELVQGMLNGICASSRELILGCVGYGPGSFIGTRTGVAFANGLASTGLKFIGVGSMEAAAALPVLNVRQVYIVRNARRHSVFAGVYRRIDGKLHTIGEKEIMLEDVGDILSDAAQSSGESRIQIITDCRAVYDEAASQREIRAAVVFKPSITDVRGMAVLAAERWDSAFFAVDVRYLRPAT